MWTWCPCSIQRVLRSLQRGLALGFILYRACLRRTENFTVSILAGSFLWLPSTTMDMERRLNTILFFHLLTLTHGDPVPYASRRLAFTEFLMCSTNQRISRLALEVVMAEHFMTQSCFSSVQSLRYVLLFVTPWTSPHIRLPCPSLSPGVCSNSCPLSHWCHPTISSSVAPFSSCPQSFPASPSCLVNTNIMTYV